MSITAASELQSLGLGPAVAARALSKYGKEAAAVVRANPYRLAEEIPGIGFQTADGIATRLGFSEDSPLRLRSGILHVLAQCVDDGHVFFPFQRLLQAAQALLQIDRKLVAQAVEALGREGKLVIDEPRADSLRDKAVYLPAFFTAETGSAERLNALLSQPRFPRTADTEPQIAQAQAALGLRLEEKQVQAVRAALGNAVTVITGGPGTGKTTVLKALLAVGDRLGMSAALAAPTGRAARRMSEATGRKAATIHRLLEYAPGGLGFRRNRANPLVCNLIVVDEASMVDTILMYHLLAALPRGASLLLVGDANQLPSVGAGQVLRDIIASGKVTTVELTEVFRQERESGIVAGAHRILLGLPPLPEPRGDEADFFVIEQEDPSRAVRTIVELVTERIPRRLALDPIEGIQVLAPMNRGTAGVENLNRVLQGVLNPADQAIGSAARGLRLGDKVMQTRNDYDREVFNGDLGRITGLGMDGQTVIVSFDGQEVTYRWEELDQLALAYALSVHKSQGSEYPAVVIPILSEHAAMLQRVLLYTAVTRGKRLAIIVGSRQALQTAVRNTRTRERYTRLAERLSRG